MAVGLADLGKKANKLFGVTLLLAYASTVIAGISAFFVGKALLPSLIHRITGSEIQTRSFEAIFAIQADPVFGVMTALILAFLLGLGIANSKNDTLLLCLKRSSGDHHQDIKQDHHTNDPILRGRAVQ